MSKKNRYVVVLGVTFVVPLPGPRTSPPDGETTRNVALGTVNVIVALVTLSVDCTLMFPSTFSDWSESVVGTVMSHVPPMYGLPVIVAFALPADRRTAAAASSSPTPTNLYAI